MSGAVPVWWSDFDRLPLIFLAVIFRLSRYVDTAIMD